MISGFFRSISCFVFLAITIGLCPVAATAQLPTRDELSKVFAEIARTVGPSVVSIDTRSRTPAITIRGSESNDSVDELMRDQPRPASNIGSGFIVDKSGLIITNSHVVADVAKIFVQLSNGEEFVAKVVGVDEETDLAVLRIDAGRELPAITVGNSDELQVGEWILAFGSPFGLAKTVTAGIVSQVRRETPSAVSRPFKRFIQTDAAINRGNSGGPLVSMRGQVIGVNSQIATSTGDSNGIAFALPINEAMRVFRQIVESGRVRRGYLGVNMESVRPAFARVYGLDEAAGAIITNISDKNSAAALAGLRQGDVILRIDDRRVADANDLVEKIAEIEPGTVVSMTIIRESETGIERRTVQVKLAERPSNPLSSPNPDRRSLPVLPTAPKPLGLTVSEPGPTQIAAFRIAARSGVIVKSIDPSSPLADLRLSNGEDAVREGEIITRINRVPVTDPKSFDEAVAKIRRGDPVVIHVLTLNARREAVLKVVQFFSTGR